MYGNFPLNAHLDSHCHALLIAIASCKATAEQTSNCWAIGCMATFTNVCQTTLAKNSLFRNVSLCVSKHIAMQLH